MATKRFHLGDILSVTTGRLLSPSHMGGIYDILNFMTGDSLSTHQLLRATDECRPYLLNAMPWLKKIDTSTVQGDDWEGWLREQVKKHGEYHMVETIPQDDHDVIDPMDELKKMVGDDTKIIGIQLDDTEPPSPFGDINFRN